MTEHCPVIAIDGPSGSGKGAISQWIAKKLGWHLLESGALYRVLALAVEKQGLALDDEDGLAALASTLEVEFIPLQEGSGLRIMLGKDDVTDRIRREEIGATASRIAVFSKVRNALLKRQRALRVLPGLVAEGRDMASVVFTDADVKIFLEASEEERARRRHAQLKEKGVDVNLDAVFAELRDRDERDKERSVAPLKTTSDALLIDTTDMTIEEVCKRVMSEIEERLGKIEKS